MEYPFPIYAQRQVVVAAEGPVALLSGKIGRAYV